MSIEWKIAIGLLGAAVLADLMRRLAREIRREWRRR